MFDATELEQHIYEAAVLPERWAGLLSNLSRSTGSFGAVLLSARYEKEIASVVAPEAASIWQDWLTGEWHLKSSRAPRLLGTGRIGWVRDLDIFTLEEIESLPEYTHFLAPRGLKWAAGASIAMPNGDTAIFSLERLETQGPFDPQTMAALNGVYGHLARASMISGLLELERERSAVDTLAALGLPAVALASNGAIRVANALFEQEHARWVTRGQDRLVLRDQRAQHLLAASITFNETIKAGRSIPLESVEGEERAVFHILPVRREARDLFTRTVVIGVLTRASDQPVVAPPLLRALFDLSNAEAMVVADLVAGLSLDEIARKRNSKVDTVRSHMKTIRAKTGCRRQAELVALMRQLAPFGRSSTA